MSISRHVSQRPLANAINAATTGMFAFGYQHILKPCFIFRQQPDAAHEQMIDFCRITSKSRALMWLLDHMLNYTDPVLETEVMGVQFANPFGLSAGLDKNCDMPIVLDRAGFGFETIGSTTARPCAGNPKPWFHRLPQYQSMMVHAGLPNDGSELVIKRAKQAGERLQHMQLSLSLARTNDDLVGDLNEGIDDYRTSLERAVGASALIEINISCPNTRVGEPFTTPENVDKLFTALDQVAHEQPILVKMPHDLAWGQFSELLAALAQHRVQGVSIANLRKNRTGLTIPSEWEGGLSGAVTYQHSNELIRRTYQAFGKRFTIAGIGGVFTPQQAYAKIRAGASLLMFISSLMFLGPQEITTLKRGLAKLLRADGFTSVAQAVGVDA